MAKIREVHVDEEGRIDGERVIVERPKRGGGFGWGMLFGVVVIAAAILGFAYTQGSFQEAGIEADQMTAQVEQRADSALENTEQAVNELSDTATN